MMKILLYIILFTSFSFALNVSKDINFPSYDYSQEEQNYIYNNKTIRFTGDPNWLPFEAFDKDGKYIGIVADNLKILEEKLDIHFEKIVSKNWTNAIDMAMSGSVDVISGDAADDILNQNFNPIESYIENPIVIIMKNTRTFVNDLNDVKDKKIVIIKDYGYTADIYKNYPNIEFREVENIQEALLGIETRKYDVALASLATSSYFISAMGLKEVVIVGKTDIVMNVTLFVNKDKPLLHSVLNKTMKSITQQEHQNILSQWNHVHTRGFINYELLMPIVAVFLILIVFFLYRQYMLAQHNKKLQVSQIKLESLSKKLQSSHDMLSKLTQNVPGVIYQYKLFADGHSCFPYSSNEIEDIYEVKSIDVIEDARAVFDVIHPDDLGMVQTSIENSAETMNDWNLQYRVNLVKNGTRWIEGFAKPERLEDGSILWHGFIHDITEEKRKDEILLAHSRNAAMGEMIGMIAHQWRQPLAAISMSMNNMLADIELEMFDIDTGKDYAKEVIDQNQHLSKTIDDFRNFFKPDKDLSIHKIEDVLEQTYSIIKKILLNNNIELKTSNESKSEIKVYPRELMQVFVNIINNAKDALLLNHVDDAIIEIKVYEDENYVYTDIYDNGLGIDEEILSKIFDPYFSTKDEKNGTGLGLYMSKMIVENNLHGKMEAFNTDNGACFRVMLKKS